MYRCYSHAANINCRGLGGRWPTQRGARGAAPARIHAAIWYAALAQSVASISGGRRAEPAHIRAATQGGKHQMQGAEGRSPLASQRHIATSIG